MNLQEAILHGITKNRNTIGHESTVIKLRDTLLPVDNKLTITAENILHIYADSVNSYGVFDSDYVRFQFPVLLKEYVSNGGDFIRFSEDVARLISHEMSNVFFATGGYVLFLRYINQGQNWLLVVMLKLKVGTGIDENTLSLMETLSFDIDHLHEAARIDLEKWLNNDQPYLSFIKKNKGSEDITHYFRQALGCTEYTDSKRSTEKMMEAVDRFCDNKGFDYERRNDARRKTYEYCAEKDRNGEPVNLSALSAHIDDQNPTEFIDYVKENGYEISETFKPHKKTFVKLKRIDAKVGNIKVSFDVADVIAERVVYDSQSNSLIINNIPQELIDTIKKVTDS